MAIEVKFCTAKRTQVPVGPAKFDLNRCNESPLRGEKPDFWPVSKFNTGSLPLRGNPAGKNLIHHFKNLLPSIGAGIHNDQTLAVTRYPAGVKTSHGAPRGISVPKAMAYVSICPHRHAVGANSSRFLSTSAAGPSRNRVRFWALSCAVVQPLTLHTFSK